MRQGRDLRRNPNGSRRCETQTQTGDWRSIWSSIRQSGENPCGFWITCWGNNLVGIPSCRGCACCCVMPTCKAVGEFCACIRPKYIFSTRRSHSGAQQKTPSIFGRPIVGELKSFHSGKPGESIVLPRSSTSIPRQIILQRRLGNIEKVAAFDEGFFDVIFNNPLPRPQTQHVARPRGGQLQHAPDNTCLTRPVLAFATSPCADVWPRPHALPQKSHRVHRFWSRTWGSKHDL